MCKDGPREITIELVGVRLGTPETLFDSLRAFEACEDEIWDRDAVAITGYYYDRGFVTVRVTHETLATAPSGAITGARYAIEEGMQFRLGQYRAHELVGERRVPPMGELKLSLKPNSVFRRNRVSLDIARLRRIYGDQGYAHVDIETEPKLDLNAAMIDLDIIINRGPIARYHNIAFDGLVELGQAEMLKTLPVAVGDVFSTSTLERAQRELMDSDKFLRVDISFEYEAETPDRLNVTIEVEERPDPRTRRDIH